jgi:very-short-patch-repair endonuclease
VSKREVVAFLLPQFSYCEIGRGWEGVELSSSAMPKKRSTPITYARAHQLRRKPTEAESKLWAFLRSHRLGDVHFRRQHAIGKYIVDFCSPRQKLIIELDGSQHLDQEHWDQERSAFLQSKGYRILRFWNNDVSNNIQAVIATIENTLSQKN